MRGRSWPRVLVDRWDGVKASLQALVQPAAHRGLLFETPIPDFLKRPMVVIIVPSGNYPAGFSCRQRVLFANL